MKRLSVSEASGSVSSRNEVLTLESRFEAVPDGLRAWLIPSDDSW